MIVASIKIQSDGYEAEIDIPDNGQVWDYLRRECMLRACADREIEYQDEPATAIQALRVAIEAHFPTIPRVKLTEE